MRGKKKRITLPGGASRFGGETMWWGVMQRGERSIIHDGDI